MTPGEDFEGHLTRAGGEPRHRDSEEFIYAGDPLHVLGGYDTEAPPAEVEDDEIDQSETAVAADEPAGANDLRFPFESGGQWPAPQALQRAAGISGFGRSAQRSWPFLLSTTPQQEMIEMLSLGAKGAVFVAVFPLALAGLLLWLRFGA